MGSLLFTAVSLRSETKTRRIANLLSITANHRELWEMQIERPELGRVTDPSADVLKQPPTPAERLFVNLVFQHTHSVYRAMSDELVVNVQGLRRDVAHFLSLPIPAEVWKRIKPTQNLDFAAFIEECRQRDS